MLVRYQERFKKTGEAVEGVIEYVKENPGRAVLFGKWTHVAGFAILIASGAARVPLLKFFGYCILGTTPKLILFIILGYVFGSAYMQIDTYLGKVSFILFVALGIFATYFIYNRRKK